MSPEDPAAGGNRCSHPGCRVAILHRHNAAGKIMRDSIDWEFLDAHSDSQMKRLIGGDIAVFLEALDR
jgi:hypothetical protein